MKIQHFCVNHLDLLLNETASVFRGIWKVVTKCSVYLNT